MNIDVRKEFDLVYINCIEAAMLLDFDIKKENIDENLFHFSTKATIWSWGETFKVQIIEVDNTNIKVEVESSANAQVFAWGKNNSNERKYIETLKNLLKQ